MKVIRHPLVKPLLGGDRWRDPLTLYRCEATTGAGHRCKNDATHLFYGQLRCCFSHAVQHIEYRTGEFVDDGMTEIINPDVPPTSQTERALTAPCRELEDERKK